MLTVNAAKVQTSWEKLLSIEINCNPRNQSSSSESITKFSSETVELRPLKDCAILKQGRTGQESPMETNLMSGFAKSMCGLNRRPFFANDEKCQEANVGFEL